METARCVIEVQAGLVPGVDPDPKFTRRWIITSAEWDEAVKRDEEDCTERDGSHAFHAALLLAFRAAEADEYARLLRNPNRFNWIRTEWIWL